MSNRQQSVNWLRWLPHWPRSLAARLVVACLLLAGNLHAVSSVVAWGANTSGQTNVPVDLTNVMTVAAGNSHSLVLKFDGTVATWGGTNYGLARIPAGLMSRWVKFCRWRKV